MTEPVGLKIGAKIELTLIKGCPACHNNQFYVVAGTPGSPPEFYWLVCTRCGNKGRMPYWPFDNQEASRTNIVVPNETKITSGHD